MENQLYFGDNLDILRKHIPSESVDLIYLDPPFNSKANYNVLFKEVDGTPSSAQIHAFTDFWHWDEVAARTYHELIISGDVPVELVDLLQGFERFLGHNDMLAYLVMMAPRLVELQRVLKSTGSIYLHCDPTASHYLKILMDAVFGKENYRNEITWKRTPFSGSSKARAGQFPRSHDIILFYTKGIEWIWNTPTIPYSEEYLKRFKWKDEVGHYRKTLLKTYSRETLERLRAGGRLIEPTKAGAKYSYKQYLHESSGERQIDDIWTDINMINPVAKERLGYPTQKPQALLDRIIQASSNEGDMVLDPFCGCGTTIAAAQALRRCWIGIDITYLAINLIESRLADHFRDEVIYEVHGIPRDWESARSLADSTDRPRKEFELWALSLVKARPKGGIESKGGGDRGIDGVRFFIDGKNRSTHSIIVQVKSDRNPGVHYVRDLVGTMSREHAVIGALILLYGPSERSHIFSEAASAGYYHSEIMNADYPKVQILCIEDLLQGHTRLQFPVGIELDSRYVAPKINKKTGEQVEL